VKGDERASPETSAPRFSGIRTFAGQPHRRELDGVDVAVVGIPFDQGTSFRAGARFGPEAIRSASALLRSYHPAHDVDVLRELEVVDWGDVTCSPGNAERAIAQLAEGLRPAVDAGVVTLGLGGDHLVALAELRALASRHGPLGLILLDSHADSWDSYQGERYFHGTPFRRAVEEGLLDPARSLLAGMRGPAYAKRDLNLPLELGFEVMPWRELRRIEPDEYGERARARAADGPLFLSFDIDFIDPAFAPATGTPEAGGPSTAEVFDYIRALAGMRFAGFDVVEVAPPYDDPGQVTALAAANVAFEMLSLAALAKR
jgi:agmatinase